MTKKVLVFFSFREHKNGYYNRLFKPLKIVENQYGLDFERGSLKDLWIQIIDNKLVVTESLTGMGLDKFDAVIMELWLKSPQQALAAGLYMRRHGVPFRGEETLDLVASTKIGEMALMADNDLPLPRTFMSSHREILRVFKSSQPIAYPFVIKAADTFGGQMNYVISSYDELKQRLAEHPKEFFVVQELIPNDCDYRVLIMGEKVRLVMRRTRTDKSSHLNNTSAGGEGEIVPLSTLSDKILQQSVKAAQLTKRGGFAGVDVLIDRHTGKHYFLEVNEAPAIQTGAHVATKIDKYMSYIAELAGAKKS